MATEVVEKDIEVIWSIKQKYKDPCLDDSSLFIENRLLKREKDCNPSRAGGSP